VESTFVSFSILKSRRSVNEDQMMILCAENIDIVPDLLGLFESVSGVPVFLRCSVYTYYCGCVQYSEALGRYFEEQHVNQLRVWTSLAEHAVDTTAFINNSVPQEHWKALNELDAVSAFSCSTSEQNLPSVL